MSIEATIEVWRKKLAEQCGKTMAAEAALAEARKLVMEFMAWEDAPFIERDHFKEITTRARAFLGRKGADHIAEEAARVREVLLAGVVRAKGEREAVSEEVTSEEWKRRFVEERGQTMALAEALYEAQQLLIRLDNAGGLGNEHEEIRKLLKHRMCICKSFRTEGNCPVHGLPGLPASEDLVTRIQRLERVVAVLSGYPWLDSNLRLLIKNCMTDVPEKDPK